jgi:hypothetical protein
LASFGWWDFAASHAHLPVRCPHLTVLKFVS